MRKFAPMIAVLAAGLSACGEDPIDISCPDILRPMMLIGVQNAGTGQSAAEGATGSISQGAFSSPLVPYDAGRLTPQVTGRPGTYTVLVQKAGFQDWTRTGVQVDADECGTETVHLEAFLVPVP
jgi:hypothetical protein